MLPGCFALGISAAASAGGETTLYVQAVPHAWIVFEDEGTRHPVNHETGVWQGSKVYTDVGEVVVGEGAFVRGVVRAPGYAPVVRLFDTAAGKSFLSLEKIDALPNFRFSYGDGTTDAGLSARLAGLVKASPEGNSEAKALQSGMRLSRATQVPELDGAIADAQKVLDGGATGPTRATALATQALGRMELWRLAAVSGKGEETRVGGAQWNELREATLRAAKAWVESGTHDPRAKKLCLAAEGTRAECGVSVDPIFR